MLFIERCGQVDIQNLDLHRAFSIIHAGNAR